MSGPGQGRFGWQTLRNGTVYETALEGARRIIGDLEAALAAERAAHAETRERAEEAERNLDSAGLMVTERDALRARVALADTEKKEQE